MRVFTEESHARMHTQLHPVIDSKGQLLPLDEPVHIHIPRPSRQRTPAPLLSQPRHETEPQSAAPVRLAVLEAA